MPAPNDEIAGIFDQYADLLKIDGANPFRVRAYRNAARMLRSMSDEAADLIEAGEDLSELPTIGKDLAGKIEEIVHTGKLSVLQSLKRSMPVELAELNRVPGLGPKRIKALNEKLGVKTQKGLRAAAKSGKVGMLEGFGQKTEQSILEYFEQDRSSDSRVRWFDAQKIANRIIAHLSKVVSPKNITVAGSYRRRKETVGDLDALVASTKPQKVTDHFLKFDEIAHIDASGKTKEDDREYLSLKLDDPSFAGPIRAAFFENEEERTGVMVWTRA